jgi:hypothetical protein
MGFWLGLTLEAVGGFWQLALNRILHLLLPDRLPKF